MSCDINKILEEELMISDEYKLKTFKEDNVNFIELSKENVKKVEAMLRYNSSYNQFNSDETLTKELCDEIKEELDKLIADPNKKNRKDKQYKFTSTHYIKFLKYLYLDKNVDKDIKKEADKYYNTLIYIILRKINSENKTRASLSEIDNIVVNLCKIYDFTSLIEELKEPAKVQDHFKRSYKLIEIISSNYKKDKERHNLSLATKFCHFLAFNLFSEGNYRDAYSIYDKVVKDNLGYYYKHYMKENEDTLCNLNKDGNLVKLYQNYQFIIDKILDKIDHIISRNGFDHIVWYTNKGR